MGRKCGEREVWSNVSVGGRGVWWWTSGGRERGVVICKCGGMYSMYDGRNVWWDCRVMIVGSGW